MSYKFYILQKFRNRCRVLPGHKNTLSVFNLEISILEKSKDLRNTFNTFNTLCGYI